MGTLPRRPNTGGRRRPVSSLQQEISDGMLGKLMPTPAGYPKKPFLNLLQSFPRRLFEECSRF